MNVLEFGSDVTALVLESYAVGDRTIKRQPIQVTPFARRRLLRSCFIDLLMGTWIKHLKINQR